MLVCANLFIGIVYVRVFAQIPVELKKKKKSVEIIRYLCCQCTGEVDS